MGLFIFVATFNLIYLQIFAVKNSKGSILVNYLIFGVGLLVGMTSSSVLMSITSDLNVYIMSVGLILIVAMVKESNGN